MADALNLPYLIVAAMFIAVEGYNWNVDSVFNCSQVKCRHYAEQMSFAYVGCLVFEIEIGLTSGCVALSRFSNEKFLFSTASDAVFEYDKGDRSFADCIENRCDRYCGAMHNSPGVCQQFRSQLMPMLQSRYNIPGGDDNVTTCVCSKTTSALTTNLEPTTTLPTTSPTAENTEYPPGGYGGEYEGQWIKLRDGK